MQFSEDEPGELTSFLLLLSFSLNCLFLLLDRRWQWWRLLLFGFFGLTLALGTLRAFLSSPRRDWAARFLFRRSVTAFRLSLHSVSGRNLSLGSLLFIYWRCSSSLNSWDFIVLASQTCLGNRSKAIENLEGNDKLVLFGGAAFEETP